MTYNRKDLESGTRANAEDVNAELTKIQTELASLSAQLTGLEVGAVAARFMWVAYADSADGTTNFSHDPAGRVYIGIATNKLVEAPSDAPEDYAWSKLAGSDAPALRLIASSYRFDFDADGNSSGTAEVLLTAEGANLSTALTWTAQNDSGNAVVLTDVTASQKKLKVADFGDAQWVRVIVSANGGDVSDTALVLRFDDLRELNYRGPYDAAADYDRNDITTYFGSAYICLNDGTTGHAPSQNAQSNAYWDVFAAKGDQGNPAAPDAAFNQTINLATSAAGANLRTLAQAAGYTGNGDATIAFVVPAGVTITGVSGGGRAIDTGTWPSDTYAIALTLEVQNGGVVRGGGGIGGAGGRFGHAGAAGGAGGDAVYCQEDIGVTVDAGGILTGGGGGGAGGNSATSGWPEPQYYGGGGGGGGYPNGAGGAGGNGGLGNGANGAAGTLAGGGLGGAGGGGGAGAGGNGGNAAAASAGGGAAGYAIRKNGNTVAVTNNGTVQGTVG